MASKGPINLLKLCLSTLTNLQLVFAMMFAALGSFLSKDRSPKY